MSKKQFEVGKTYQIQKEHVPSAQGFGSLTFPDTRQFKCHHIDEHGFCWSMDVLYEGVIPSPIKGTCIGSTRQLDMGVFKLVSGEQ